jgi:hypothetical protein
VNQVASRAADGGNNFLQFSTDYTELFKLLTAQQKEIWHHFSLNITAFMHLKNSDVNITQIFRNTI